MTIPTDIFPLSSVGSVAGLIGFGGAVGGATFNIVAGELLAHAAGYGTLFVLAGSLHAVAFGIILLTSGFCERPAGPIYFQTRGDLVLTMKITVRYVRALCSGPGKRRHCPAFLHQPNGSAGACHRRR